MPPAQDTKLYRTFVKGLITEASPLTFPENASYDEDNCLLWRKGNRSRRLGIDHETDYELSSYTTTISSGVSSDGLSEYVWEEVGSDEGVNFLVHQVGLALYFYDMSSQPISGNYFASVSLSDHLAPQANITLAQQGIVAMTTAKGSLFVAGKFIEPLMLQWDPDAEVMDVTEIVLQTRDLKGVDDELANDEEPLTLSIEHHYNLQNQGWTSASQTPDTSKTVEYFGRLSPEPSTYNPPLVDVINIYLDHIERYPSNSKQWFVGKSTDGVFDPEFLNKSYFGNASAPRGHFILNALHKDRSLVSGIAGLALETIKNRPTHIETVAGRLWYLCDDIIYFTQVLDDKLTNVGRCYQEADPTSETINDLVATDGGTIPLPDVGVGKRMVASGGGLLIFGTRGVSFIHGTDQGFSATTFEITKVSPVGTDAPHSIIETAEAILYMSKVGIQVLKQENGNFTFSDPTASNLSLKTIQTFFQEEIPDESKPYIKAAYDASANLVQWLFKSDLTLTKSNYIYDRILNLDMTLGAFYPWTVSVTDPSPLGVNICGVFNTPRFTTDTNDVGVLAGPDNVIVVADEVVTTSARFTIAASEIKYISLHNNQFTISQFDDTDFVDWKAYSGDLGNNYLSFLETGYEILEDAMRQKQSPWVYCYFKRTETGYVLDGDDYELENQSHCDFRIKWDWTGSSTANKWSEARQVYRLNRLPPFDEGNLVLNDDWRVVVTKNKVRGIGRALQFRFECDEGFRDFDLLGWSVQYRMNPQP